MLRGRVYAHCRNRPSLIDLRQSGVLNPLLILQGIVKMTGMTRKLNRDRRLRLNYTGQEYEQLKVLAARSGHRTMSGYVRQVSLQKPVIVAIRNQSFDHFIDEMIVLRKEMGAIREKTWLSPEQKERVIGIHEEIRILINKIAELCTPKLV